MDKLEQIIKLNPNQYESFYSGNLVTSGEITLQLNTTNYNIIINNTKTLTRDQYTIEVSDKFLDIEIVKNLFDLSVIDNHTIPVDDIVLYGTNEQLLVTSDNKYFILKESN